MREPLVRAGGIAGAAAYAVLIVWLFASQPRSVTEAVGGLSATLGTYAVDARAFQDGLDFFHRDQFDAARTAFARADPAGQDARTHFYIAYSYYREGWHRTHHDDALYEQGLKHVARAIELAPDHRLVVDDQRLQLRSADQLQAELRAGLSTTASDFNPLRLFEGRK